MGYLWNIRNFSLERRIGEEGIGTKREEEGIIRKGEKNEKLKYKPDRTVMKNSKKYGFTIRGYIDSSMKKKFRKARGTYDSENKIWYWEYNKTNSKNISKIIDYLIKRFHSKEIHLLSTNLEIDILPLEYYFNKTEEESSGDFL